MPDYTKLFLARLTGGKPNSRRHSPQEVRVEGNRIVFRLGGSRRCKDVGRYLKRHEATLTQVARFS